MHNDNPVKIINEGIEELHNLKATKEAIRFVHRFPLTYHLLSNMEKRKYLRFIIQHVNKNHLTLK